MLRREQITDVLSRLDARVQLPQLVGFSLHSVELLAYFVKLAARTQRLTLGVCLLALCGRCVDFRLLLLGVRLLELV